MTPENIVLTGQKDFSYRLVMHKKEIEMKIRRMQWGSSSKNDYNMILDYYSGTSINSIKTSSIPLSQLWKKTETILRDLSKNIKMHLSDVNIFFEFPTKSYGSNKASMSDVMIITDDVKIAVEGKYTEYDYSPYEKIKNWFEKGARSNNRNEVLNHWKKIIEAYSDLDMERFEELPYQFLHRTASACFENPKKAIVLYQIFWDSESQKIDTFLDELKDSVRIINPRENLEYYVEKVEVKSIEFQDKDLAFQKLKEEDIFNFGKIEWIKI